MRGRAGGGSEGKSRREHEGGGEVVVPVAHYLHRAAKREPGHNVSNRDYTTCTHSCTCTYSYTNTYTYTYPHLQTLGVKQ